MPEMPRFKIGMSVQNGFGGSAYQFLYGAEALLNQHSTIVACAFLCCVSTECGLKSFLSGKGVGEGKLRKLGHDLEALWGAARTQGLKMEPPEWLGAVNGVYKTPHLKYPINGVMGFGLPNLEGMTLDIRKLLASAGI